MDAPLVSIGLPVFNGEPFLERALNTLLGQDLADLELVISDNGSTDATESICRDASATDRRVRYHRNDRNRGAAWNFNNVLALANASARYFTWAAADDERAPSYLSRTVAILDADPSVALAHTGSADIDEEGYVLHVWNQPVSQLEDPRPWVRLRDLLTLNHECFQAFGIMPMKVARATRGLGAFADADNVFLVEIALQGRFVQDPETLFFRRQHSERSMAHYADQRARIAWFDPAKANRITYPTWRVGREVVEAIRRANLSPADRRACYACMRVFLRWNWPALAKNVIRSSVEQTRKGVQRVMASGVEAGEGA
jgi:glycosyltransferase involved in cell wall biosynthesis